MERLRQIKCAACHCTIWYDRVDGHSFPKQLYLDQGVYIEQGRFIHLQEFMGSLDARGLAYCRRCDEHQQAA